jgi:hypothetical protein
MKRARPISIWLLGASCVPSACRRKWNTTISLVKQVIEISMAGIKLRSVSRTIICTGRAELVEFKSRDMTGLGAGTAGTVGATGAALMIIGNANMDNKIIRKRIFIIAFRSLL